jgi:hypothetical protein
MWHNLKVRIKRMSKAWTENNDGKTLPSDVVMDASQHSGDAPMNTLVGEELDAEIEKRQADIDILIARRDGDTTRHIHQWVPGELPGAVRIRTCKAKLQDGTLCGKFEKV